MSNISEFSSMNYHIFRDYNLIFDEKGSTYGTLRLAQWVKAGKEPEEEKAKLEIRKIYTTAEGEKFGKGYTFATENGPAELCYGLIDSGFGETKELLRHVMMREDFKESLSTLNEVDEDVKGEMFDMRDLMNFSEDMEDAG